MRIIIDPNHAYPYMDKTTIFESCGLLPHWILESPDIPIKECLDKNYALYGGFKPFNGPHLDSKSRFCYPGDPPVNPLIVITSGTDTFRQYQSGFVAVTTVDGKTEFARLD